MLSPLITANLKPLRLKDSNHWEQQRRPKETTIFFFFFTPSRHFSFLSFSPLLFPFFSLAGKEGKEKQADKNALSVPRLSVCADGGKVDRARLCQTEVRVTVPQTTERRQTQVRSFFIFFLMFIYLYSPFGARENRQTNRQTRSKASSQPPVIPPFPEAPPHILSHGRTYAMGTRGASVTGVTVSHIRDTSLSFSRPPSCLDLAPFWVYMHTHKCIYT